MKLLDLRFYVAEVILEVIHNLGLVSFVHPVPFLRVAYSLVVACFFFFFFSSCACSRGGIYF